MSELLRVIPSKSSGGSPAGLSFWLSFLGCRRRQLLDKDMGSSFAAGVGTLYHTLKELYYGPQGDEFVFEYQEGPEDPNWQEALRLFKGFRQRFPNDEFTEVVGVEVDISVGAAGSVLGEPMAASEIAMAAEARHLYGVPYLTGRIDMVVYVDEDCAAKHRESGLMLEEGYYLLDTKSKGQLRQDMAFKFQHSFQSVAYQMMWNQLNPDKPVKGMIFDVVIRHKKLEDRSFVRVLVPPPTAADLDTLRHTLNLCHQIRETLGDDFANPTECFGWGPCRHLTSGACEGK